MSRIRNWQYSGWYGLFLHVLDAPLVAMNENNNIYIDNCNYCCRHGYLQTIEAVPGSAYYILVNRGLYLQAEKLSYCVFSLEWAVKKITKTNLPNAVVRWLYLEYFFFTNHFSHHMPIL